MRTTIVTLLAACGLAANAAAGACDLLSEAEAVKLVGAALGAVEKSESKPDATNGHDYTTVCGYFPKGYDLKTAEGPPDAGILVTLHTMPDAAAAKRYYEGVMGMLKENHEPVKPVSGIGDGAYLHPFKMPGSPVQTTTLTFLKANVMAMVQVWKKAAAAPDDIARAASLQAAGKLHLPER